MFDRLDDTIVAISTPPGAGMKGAIRISGSGAAEVVARIFAPNGTPALVREAQNARAFGRLVLGDDLPGLPAEAVFFWGSRSYTRETVVELHTVASPAVLAWAVQRAIIFGARQAGPGEFTARAFCRGGMAWEEVEGVCATIKARSDEQLRAAREWREGRISRRLAACREELIDLLSLVEADLDFSEEPIEFFSSSQLIVAIAGINKNLGDILLQMATAKRASSPPRIFFVGAPNSGKSTLVNKLSGTSRAICSPVPGTTRDFLSAMGELGGVAVEFLDTPGLGPQGGKFEKLSQKILARELQHAEMICHTLDMGIPGAQNQVFWDAPANGSRIFWVASRADLCPEEQREARLERWLADGHEPICASSALDAASLNQLKNRLAEHFRESTKPVDNQGVLISAEAQQRIRGAADTLTMLQSRLLRAGEASLPSEQLAEELRRAIHFLSELFGEMAPEEFLGRIFEGFCIGK